MTLLSMRGTSIIGAALLGAGLFTAIGAPTAQAAVGGTVKCSSGAVVGMWVEAKDKSKSGWAWTQNNGERSQQWKRGELGPNDKYKVRVGCGGTTDKWDKSVKSAFWSGWTTGNKDFDCYEGAVISVCQ